MQLSFAVGDYASRLVETRYVGAALSTGDIVISSAYDANDRPSSRTDAESNTDSYTYNSRNQLTQITYPDSTTKIMKYDDAGNLLYMQDQLGNVFDYTYDEQRNLLRAITVTPATGVNGNRLVNYDYDALGRCTMGAAWEEGSLYDVHRTTNAFNTFSLRDCS